MSELPKEIFEESLEANLERQKELFNRIHEELRAVGLSGIRKCAEASGEIPEMIMATIANFLQGSQGLPMLSGDEALEAAAGPFMVGYYLGMRHGTRKVSQ